MKIQEAKKMVAILLKNSEPERSKRICDFQNFICNYRPDEPEEALYDILYNLAWDLDFYEPNPKWRQECPGCYYGEEKLVENIQEALEAINLWEIKNQNEQKDKD